MEKISMEMQWQNNCRLVRLKNMKKIPSLKEFNLIIQGVLDENKIGHLFVVDIEFDKTKCWWKQLFKTPIFEKMFYVPMKDLLSNF